MFIRTVYIRFFRSFNHDYLRKSHPDSEPRGPWEMLPGDLWYPFAEIGLQSDITTVVGANEAGKTQLLDAIKFALTGEGISERDFCRYSQFFAVNRKMSHPDFGLRLTGLTPEEGEAVALACGLDKPVPAEGFHLFRFDNRTPTVYLRSASGEYTAHDVTDEDALLDVLPQVFEIDSQVPLPDSVPISYLIDGALPHYAERSARQNMVRTLTEKASEWFGTAATVTSQADLITEALAPDKDTGKDHEREFRLARELLVNVAGVDKSAFVQLQGALSRGSDGQANGIVTQINQELAKHLNFPKYWTQDTDFALMVGLRELDLVFTIRDRTGTDYSFSERSGGLRFFLSYFVQTLAHRPAKPLAREILLMDEPDAFLSSSGQQDLLRIFQDFAQPLTGGSPSQVVYVTHSPFLIDKNHSERIRVLDKGQGDEGTRVVANSARNHYEPLRSAFGSFVGETTFISNCNLLLEGQSDQILLAGMSTMLRTLPTPPSQFLDLNQITLVPAGSASHVPYLAYLALGRDADTPAVIALLDSDTAGNDALAALQHGPTGKPILKDRFVLQLGALDSDKITSSRAGGVKEIEDLIPPALVLLGAQRYVKDIIGPDEHAKVTGISAGDLDLGDGKGLHAAVEQAFLAVLGNGFHLDKLGLARSIVDMLPEAGPADVETVATNFRHLFQEINRVQRDANLGVLKKRVGSRVKRARKTFFMDHPHAATCEAGILLLEDFERQLDDSPVADDWRIEIRRVRREFRLDEDLLAPINDYDGFQTGVDGLVTFEQRASIEVPPDDLPPVTPAKPRRQPSKRASQRS